MREEVGSMRIGPDLENAPVLAPTSQPEANAAGEIGKGGRE